MALKAVAQAELCRLRRDIARIEGRRERTECLVLDPAQASPPGFGPRRKGGRLSLGVQALDVVLGGGLPLATLHEVRAVETRDGGAAGGFLMALVARLAATGSGPAVWVSEADVRRETGRLYAPGLARHGLDPGRIVEVAARTEAEALWTFEAALSCAGLGAAVCELRQASLDLAATRRCVLRARETGVTGFLMRLGGHVEPSAAELRFRLSPLPARDVGPYAAGIGRAAWRLTLEKNRGGRTGVFALEWNAHERVFAERRRGGPDAHPERVPAASSNRPAHPERAAPSHLRRAS
jgi:protein ImuA